MIVNHHPAGAGLTGTNISATHEYAIFLTPIGKKVLNGEEYEDKYSEIGFMRTGTAESNLRIGRPNSFYALLVDEKAKEIRGIEPPPKLDEDYPLENNNEGLKRIYPRSSDGTERVWRRSYESCKNELEEGNIICTENLSIKLISEKQNKYKPIYSNWVKKKYNAGVYGTKILNNIMGVSLFSYPKSIHNVMDCVSFSTKTSENAIVLDFFAGSGTTGHAVVNLNRKSENQRDYILVEMGEYFSSVTKPRIQKVVYSKDWNNGKPVDREGVSHMFKYLRLESYEDTLNNLALTRSEQQQQLLTNEDLKEEYILNYMLDVETRESLLNTDMFERPFGYTIEATEHNELVSTEVDLVETFNYLIGLHVVSIQMIKGYVIVTGHNNDGEHILVIWRDTKKHSNEELEDFVNTMEFNPLDGEFDTIYINGDNNLQNLRKDEDTWKVRLIEEEFHKRMFDEKSL